MKTEIVFLGMGGTIAGKAPRASDNVGYKAAELTVQALVDDCVGGLAREIGCCVTTEQVVQKDSKDMQLDDWALLVQRIVFHLARPEVRSVVVTHGTDTLEEGAYFLHLSLPRHIQSEKSVVITCAMRPASSSTPDGPQNLRDALVVAMSPDIRGTYLVCGGEIHAGYGIRKVHSYRLQAFESPETGPLGYVEEQKIRWCGRQLDFSASGAGAFSFSQERPIWARVEIVFSHSHVSEDLIPVLLDHSFPKIEGLVLAGTGNGTVHTALLKGIQRAQARGVAVVLATRCLQGPVIPAIGLGPFCLLPGPTPSPFQARIGLILALACQRK